LHFLASAKERNEKKKKKNGRKRNKPLMWQETNTRTSISGHPLIAATVFGSEGERIRKKTNKQTNKNYGVQLLEDY
jgi:hypothetical protein